jgi:predicted porin
VVNWFFFAKKQNPKNIHKSQKNTLFLPKKGLKLWKHIAILTLILFLALPNNKLFAQERCKKVPILQTFTDSLTIVPNSFRFQTVDTTLKIVFDFNKNQVSWQSKQVYTSNDSIVVCYQVLPIRLQEPIRKRESIDTLNFFITPLQTIFEQNQKREEIISTDSIQKTGAIYRGLAVGNQQGAIVNSALNLQLEGKLNPEIGIRALLTDQQVPFQPEGNTQQVQQLDRVLIELYSKTSTLQAGDIVMQNKTSEFLRFYKNVQGVQLSTQQGYKDSSRSVSAFGVALAKGRFASTAITSIEGVQGPYRLRGANNERFIVIIANTEKVYVDNKPLRRGFDADYIIDYNLAEITFNPNVLITQYTRIRVDYEYTERNYSRTNMHASHFQEYKNLTLFGQFYSETDNPRNPLAINLSDEQKLQLSQIGDNLSAAFVQTADSVGFTAEAILYERKDTLTANGLFEDVFVFSRNPQRAFWQVVFTEVGEGKGNYRLRQTLQNGRIFEWVEPIGGIRQGNFEPISLVPLPQKRQMATLGLLYKPTNFEQIALETAFSQRDLNRFSKIDNEDNKGFALKATLRQKDRWHWGKYQWQNTASYEFNNPTFQPIDRFRSVEFNRDWNLNLDTLSKIPAATEHIFHLHSELRKDAQNFFATTHTYRHRVGSSEGWQNGLAFSQKTKKWSVKSDVFLLNAVQENNQKSDWQRFTGEIAYKTKHLTKGYAYLLDKNTLRQRANDSITFSAMNFDEHKIFLKTNDSSQTRFGAEYSYRTDNQPIDGNLEKRTLAQTIQTTLQTKASAKQNLRILATYRNIENFLFGQRNEENLMGRVEWQRQFWQKNIRSELVWQNTSARELQREFSFIQVPTGQGTHTWRDDNGNGIAELNEFYLALNPDERQFAKIFTPTDRYIRAFSTDLNYRLNLQAPTDWARGNWLKKSLSYFSLIGSALIRRKTTEDDFFRRIFPFSRLDNEQILSAQENLRATLFFNRGNPDLGADLNFVRGGQKQLLVSGFESRKNQEWGFSFRKNLSKKWTSNSQFRYNSLQNESDFLLNRNFQIQTWGIQLQVTYQPSPNLRVSVANLQSQKKNLQGVENLYQQEWSSEVRWSKPSLFVISAQIRWVDLRLEGETASPVAYEMLEALQVGKNWVWTATYQQRLGNGLQLNFTYNGRKMSLTPNIIHFGQVQAGVLF